MKFQIHNSYRNIPLSWLYEIPEGESPVVCVELYCKWYRLHVIHPDGTIEEFPFPDDYLDTGETPYLDHAPNPMTVQRWAEKMNYHLCDLALELMIGRWEMEYKNNYRYDPEEGNDT